MNDRVRIELLVIDIIERIRIPQDIRIRRNGKIRYTGSVVRIPAEFLNEKVASIHTNDYTGYLYIDIK